MLIFILLIVIISSIATFIEYLAISKIKATDRINQDTSKLEESKLVKYLLCFSVITNLKRLFTSRSQEKLGEKDTMELLNSVRVLSIGWVILGHTLFHLSFTAVISNYDKFQDKLAESNMIIPISGEVSVDTFFWLSGFLIGYLLITEINNGRKMNWSIVYIHRYLRLTPLLLFCVLFFWAFQKHIGSGPMFFNGDFLNNPCKNYWWADILYLNNMIPDYETSTCLGQTWYLANDMQFFIITPPVLYFYHNSRKSIV